MNKIPYEVSLLITDTFNLFDEISYSLTNVSNYYELKNSVKDKITKLKRLQLFYKKKRTHFPFEESYMNIYFEPPKKRKNFINRCYIAKYPLLLLYGYPEYFLEKTSIYCSDVKKHLLQAFIHKLPPEKQRTRRHIRKFLDLDCITVRDIVYVGW